MSTQHDSNATKNTATENTDQNHNPRYRPIADYAIIGNTRTAALVASNGSLDWCCCPRFDSPAVFLKTLDADKGGRFRIGPGLQHYRFKRAYVDATNVMTTVYTVEGGTFRLTDFMPVSDATASDGTVSATAASQDNRQTDARTTILRRVEGLSGECEVEIEFMATFDFARASSQIEISGNRVLVHGSRASVVLHTPVPLLAQGEQGVGTRFRIKAGEQADFSLVFHEHAADQAAGDAPDKAPDVERLLAQTIDYWRKWSSQCIYTGPYRELVLRSALTLKLLTYTPSGAIVAAPTTSLPEEIGGARNWDYRYTWIRDSSMILDALMSTGFHSEAHAFFGWLESLCIACAGELKTMYTITGGKDLPEQQLSHLEGYCGSRPVRIGNAAAGQKQLDIYGELLDAVFYCYESMRMQPPSAQTWEMFCFVADQAAAHWQEPDEGIWEMRGGQQHHLYSKLQCWVALDRAVRLAEKRNLPADLDHWRSARDEIRQAILSQGYDAELGAFTQAFGVKELDAAALTIPILGFLPATDPRVRSTMEKIQQHLTANGLVYRYLNEDGLPGGESTFLLCSFWLVDNLAMAGKIDDARTLFEKIISYGNDVGLFAEELDPANHAMMGNFPQGFTHLALIRSAVRLAESA